MLLQIPPIRAQLSSGLHAAVQDILALVRRLVAALARVPVPLPVSPWVSVSAYRLRAYIACPCQLIIDVERAQ